MGFLVAQLAAVHFQQMTCCLECLTDAGEASARKFFGDSEGGQTMRMGCILSGVQEFVGALKGSRALHEKSLQSTSHFQVDFTG